MRGNSTAVTETIFPAKSFEWRVLYAALSICPFLWQRVYLKINQKVAMALLRRRTALRKYYAYAVCWAREKLFN